MQTKNSGFTEIYHTGDAAIRVWGATPDELFQSALAGMYQLMRIASIGEQSVIPGTFQVDGSDLETLLVSFLSECLYFAENELQYFSTLSLLIEEYSLGCTYLPSKIISLEREIKAVTYHNLSVQARSGLWEATVVFDL